MITEKPKFTPAPWIKEVSRLDSGGLFTSIREKNVNWDEGFICHICAVGDDARHNRIANLIAAAPEMYGILEELEKIIEYVGEYEVPLGFQDRVKATLKKARGEA